MFLVGGCWLIWLGFIWVLDFFGGEGLWDWDGWFFEFGVDFLLGWFGLGVLEFGFNGFWLDVCVEDGMVFVFFELGFKLCMVGLFVFLVCVSCGCLKKIEK